MKIIIPMTGYGARFVAAGYTDLKPFIPVDGKPIIQWIVEGMYPAGTDYLFICRGEHLAADPAMEARLKAMAPGATVAAIGDWVKKGPVWDVLRCADLIPDDEACIINYCDFYQRWDWPAFVAGLEKRGCDGAVPCYTGFHPHLLRRGNLYASCRVDEDENLIEIREKFSFEANKQKARHSPGIYYFRTGALLKTYCQKLVEGGPALSGEYYASLPYNYMVADGLKVWVPANVQQFCQWGTPEDLAEYNFWMGLVKGAKAGGA